MGLLSRLRGKGEAHDVPAKAPAEDAVAVIRQQEVEALRSVASLPEMDPEGNDPMALAVHARIVRHSDGFGYEVCVGGVPAVVQRYHPLKEGDAPMSMDEASEMARRALDAYGRE
jgi:hypothetical protein